MRPAAHRLRTHAHCRAPVHGLAWGPSTAIVEAQIEALERNLTLVPPPVKQHIYDGFVPPIPMCTVACRCMPVHPVSELLRAVAYRGAPVAHSCALSHIGAWPSTVIVEALDRTVVLTPEKQHIYEAFVTHAGAHRCMPLHTAAPGCELLCAVVYRGILVMAY